MATTEEVLAAGWRSPDIIRLMLYDAGSRQSSLLSRIFDRCVLVDNGYAGGPCLEWTGPCSGKPGRGRAKGRGHSYPRMNVDGHTAAVHRVVWVCLNGYLPAKRQLDHLCRSRRCVIHCEPVTHKQNQKRKPK